MLFRVSELALSIMEGAFELRTLPFRTEKKVEEVPEESIKLDLAGLGLHKANRNHLFGLHVRGDSMSNAHILDGDLAILEKKAYRPGDIVAALIDGETTLKRLVVKNKRVFLRAENRAFKNLYPAEALEIQGVVIGIIRVGVT